MYILQVNTPYEGISEYRYETLEDIKAHIKRNHTPWDDCTILMQPRYVDIYELMAEGDDK
jgi:hypothetical protein